MSKFASFKKTKLFKIIWCVYDKSSVRLIVERFHPPAKGSNRLKRAPSSFFFWSVSAYVALFGLASQRHESIATRIEVRANALVSQLGATQNDYEFKEILSDVPRIQLQPCPTKPDLKKPWSIITSLMGRSVKHNPTVTLLSETVQNWKHRFSVNPQITSLDYTPSKSTHPIAIFLDENGVATDYERITANVYPKSGINRILREETKVHHVQISYFPRRMKLDQVIMNQTDLSNTDLELASFVEAELSGVNFRGSRLAKTVFIAANLSHSSLACVNMRTSDLQWADLSYATLSTLDSCTSTGWNSTTMMNTNIYEIRGATPSFITWAKAAGAVELSPQDWIQYKEDHQSEIKALVSQFTK